jgi:hypothetical protein
MGIYRIHESGVTECVGVIVAKNKAVANAFAQGKYGAGASTEKVDYRMALEAGHVCEIIATHEKSTGLHGTIRVIT